MSARKFGAVKIFYFILRFFSWFCDYFYGPILKQNYDIFENERYTISFHVRPIGQKRPEVGPKKSWWVSGSEYVKSFYQERNLYSSF